MRPLWEECTLQTYFTSPGSIDFVVVNSKKGDDGLGTSGLAAPLKPNEEELFIRLEDSYQNVNRDIKQEASAVHDFGLPISYYYCRWVPTLPCQ
jgi:hypothetical protein